MINVYIFVFLSTAILSYCLTLFFRFLAPKIGAMDYPDERKIHKKPVARFGGVALFISFFIAVFLTVPPDKHLLGIFIGALILLIFGILDDVKGLNPYIKLIGQFLAALAVVVSGVGINYITNPFGGLIFLDAIKIPISLFGTTYHIILLADLFAIFWILILINAVNFLDGLDGLASGVSGISAFIIFLLSLSPDVSQPYTALIALILAAACFGFLPLNFFPAKIFMGDSGSMFLGFTLAVLAIFSGGKVATALLVLGLPILDVFWAVLRRTIKGHSPFKPDKKHIHHTILNKGFSQKQTVLLIYAITIFFGITALLSRAFSKLIALLALVILVFALISFFYFWPVKNSQIDRN